MWVEVGYTDASEAPDRVEVAPHSAVSVAARSGLNVGAVTAGAQGSEVSVGCWLLPFVPANGAVIFCSCCCCYYGCCGCSIIMILVLCLVFC